MINEIVRSVFYLIYFLILLWAFLWVFIIEKVADLLGFCEFSDRVLLTWVEELITWYKATGQYEERMNQTKNGYRLGDIVDLLRAWTVF